MSQVSAGYLPRLGVLHHPSSVEVLALARAARGQWRTVWLVDRRITPDEDDLRQLARFGEVIDLTGLEPAEAATRIREPLGGLLATNDPDLVRAAELAGHLGLSYFDASQVAKLNDKYTQRDALHTAGLPSPRCVALLAGMTTAQARAAAESLTYPAVLKPAHGASSRATYEVWGPDEVVTRLTERRIKLAPAEDFVVEERIPDGWAPKESAWGDYLSVESLAVEGRIEHFGITGRGPLSSGFRETGTIMPTALPESEWPEFFGLAEAAIRGLGLTTGVFHTEIKLSPQGPRLIEVNGRLGGGSIPWLAERVADHSLLAAAGRVNLGLAPQTNHKSFNGVGFAHYVQPPLEAKQIASIDGVEATRELAGVEELLLAKGPGEPLNPTEEGTQGFVMRIRGWVANHSQLADLLSRIEETLVISYR